MKRVLCLTLTLIMILISGCTAVSQAAYTERARLSYQSYRDIPGVTQADIDALEELLAKKPRLVYGMCTSTEAFERSDGSVGGFTELLCNRLSELFGFKFDIYTCGWDELNEKIVSKEIDFSSDFTPSPERLEKFFMTDAIVQRTIKMFTDINSESLNSIAETRPIKYGFLEGSTTYSVVSKSWNLPFEPVPIHSQAADVPGLLLRGEIDVFIDEGTLEAGYDTYDFIKAEEYYPLTYSPVSLTTGNPELKPIIDIMQKYLKNGGYYELTELYNQGYKDYLRNKLFRQLTEEEKEYILSHNTEETAVSLACESSNYPSSFFNSKEKKFQGIAIDILNQVSALTDLKFNSENSPGAPWSDLFEGLENGKYSIVTALFKTANRENRFLWVQEPYCMDNYAMLSRADQPDVDINQILFTKVGLIEDIAYTDVFLEWFPFSENTITYKSNDEAFTALEKGEIDLLMASQNLLLHFTNYLEKPGFKANVVFSYSTGSFFGLNKDELILRSIINKAQRYIDTEEIASSWQRKVFDYQSKMLRDVIPYTIAFTAILLAALFVVFVLFIKNRRINKNLEELVSSRTNELASQAEKLETALEMAESASKAKGDFLSRMSHEIRTPLNAIIGMINIAMGADDNAKIQGCLSKADNASKHLLGVINDVLDMSKIEADKFELDHREFDFEKMIMNVTNVTNFRAEEKKQNFIVNLNRNVPESIIGDDLRLSQVITNLLTNAVKFTPENGTVVLNIDKIEDDNNAVTLRVEVEDNGIGISEEQQKRLFTSFEQADGGIARRFGGTGLGLAISKRIVELMGGRIWIESELGNGSKFIFTMKAGKGKEKTHAKLSEKINRDDLHILAVDGSPEIREYFVHVMESLGLPCDVAGNGAEALDMIKSCEERPYNIFFVDWQMPEMNGIELARKIKETAPDNSIVFMISANEWGAIEKDAIAVGVRSFISKPLFPSTLVNAINDCVDIKSVKSEINTENPEDKKRRDFSRHIILIAEDVEINREIMSAILEDTGAHIDFAENGSMAVSAFENNPDKYNLIMMDIHMPEMDGYEATRRIRALELPEAKGVPIIAMTANVFREDIEACLAAGMNDHIGKPVDQDEIFTKLERYLPQI